MRVDARSDSSTFKLEVYAYNGGADVIFGGGGNDELQTEEGDDRVSGGDGDDFIQGGDGADLLRGGAGNDRILSADFFDDTDGTFADIINAGAGDDDIWAGYGDAIDGGDGIDVLHARYEIATEAIVYRAGRAAHIGGARIVGIENVDLHLGAFADRIDLRSATGDQIVAGGDGNDRMIGGAGKNSFSGGDGDDHLFAGNGIGDIFGAAGDDVIVGGARNDILQGGDGADRIGGGRGADFLAGGDGNDRLDGGHGADSMDGSYGDDRFRVDNIGDVVMDEYGAAGGYDTVVASIDYTLGFQIERLVLIGAARSGTGNALDNVIIGARGADVLTGLDGDDVLDGGDGNDTLDGGEGDDRLTGGAGRDFMSGGVGADRFVFTDGDSGTDASTADRIADFSHADGDRIVLKGIEAVAGTPGSAFAFIGSDAFHNVAGELRYSFVGRDTLIEGDTNGDGVADLAIRLSGHVELVRSDFTL